MINKNGLQIAYKNFILNKSNFFLIIGLVLSVIYFLYPRPLITYQFVHDDYISRAIENVEGVEAVLDAVRYWTDVDYPGGLVVPEQYFDAIVHVVVCEQCISSSTADALQEAIWPLYEPNMIGLRRIYFRAGQRIIQYDRTSDGIRRGWEVTELSMRSFDVSR